MGQLWIPGAERLTPSKGGGLIESDAEPRAVWHTTEAPSGDPRMFQRMHEVLTGKSAEPHVLIDPKTDRMGQYFPLNLSARALKNEADGTRTNRTGIVCIQIEVIAYAAHPFTDDWTPGPNWRALVAALRSWDIPDELPAGPPPKFPGPSNRPRTTWHTKGGHYSHANIPDNNHGDPGAISMPKIFALGKIPTTPPKQEVHPLSDLTDADAAKIGVAVAKALQPVLDTTEQKYTVADNNYDSQRAAWEAVGQAYAAHLLAGGAPIPADTLNAARDAVWAYYRPLWGAK